jgi:hypothetical protein
VVVQGSTARDARAMRVILPSCVDDEEAEGAGRGTRAATFVPRTKLEGHRLHFVWRAPPFGAEIWWFLWASDLVSG